MPAAFPVRGQWHIDTPNKRLALALAVSLIIHVMLYASWRVAPAVAGAIRVAATRVLKMINPRLLRAAAEQPQKESAVEREVPLVFVEIDPALASAEPPKEARFYSTQNSVAANEQPRTDSEVPHIDGTQTKIVRLMDNPTPQPKLMQPEPKPEPQPLQPAPPRQPAVEPQPKPQETTPRPPETVGELALAKPEPRTAVPVERPAEPQPRPKPRTLREVVQRNPALAGQIMRQEGGIPRRGRIQVDAKQSAFGDYDYQFIKAVEQCWFQLLGNNQYMLDRQGKVVLEFRLHQDGRVTGMAVHENSVGDLLSLLCQKAILDPAPFPKWPAEMRRLVKEDFRDVRFTFYYD